MFAKLVVLCAVVAVAYGGVIASLPASTTLLAAPAPAVIAHPQIAAVRTVVAAPQVATVHAAPAVIAAPQVIQTGTKVIQTVEPVEQHGYSIAY